jgi:hypothetical protein
MPVILATQEVEIRKIMVQNQFWANSSQDPILKIANTNTAGRVTHVVEHLPKFKPQYSRKIAGKKLEYALYGKNIFYQIKKIPSAGAS